jgi:hypothetical protein
LLPEPDYDESLRASLSAVRLKLRPALPIVDQRSPHTALRLMK